MTKAYYQTPVGPIHVTLENNCITELELGEFDPETTDVSYDIHYAGVQKQLGEQLRRYFADPGKGFDIDMENRGTEFQRQVWRALQQIPVGQTLTYGQLASQLQSSPRAVGNACRQNHLPLLVPCHRVIGSDGKLTGYAGGLKKKRWLLHHEWGVLHGKQASLFPPDSQRER